MYLLLSKKKKKNLKALHEMPLTAVKAQMMDTYQPYITEQATLHGSIKMSFKKNFSGFYFTVELFSVQVLTKFSLGL